MKLSPVLTITVLCVDDEDDKELVPEFDVGLALWPGQGKARLADKTELPAFYRNKILMVFVSFKIILTSFLFALYT